MMSDRYSNLKTPGLPRDRAPRYTGSAMSLWLPCFLALAGVLSPDAAWSDIEMYDAKIFGHSVSHRLSVPTDSMGPLSKYTLEVDSRIHINAEKIEILNINMLDEVPFLVGTVFNGGNICDPQPFLVSLPINGESTLLGPVETCHTVAIEYSLESVIFREYASPGSAATVWTWSPKNGVTRSEALAPQGMIDPWKSIWTRAWDHPSEILKSKHLTEEIEPNLGTHFALYKFLLDGPGSGSYRGDFWFGSSCQAHACGEAGQLTVIDMAARRIYIAVKPSGEKIVVIPDVKEWPSAGRQQLKEWAKNF